MLVEGLAGPAFGQCLAYPQSATCWVGLALAGAQAAYPARAWIVLPVAAQRVVDLIDQLKEDGLYEDTIIFFWSDHGVGLPRAKRWLYDSGTHIPLIIRIPEKFRQPGQGDPGTMTDQLVNSIDFGPTVLNLAGLEAPINSCLNCSTDW